MEGEWTVSHQWYSGVLVDAYSCDLNRYALVTFLSREG